jgi:putative NIF3 family GTP cyclohydrolase 1 type 2
MNQAELAHRLDAFFNVLAFDERDFWAQYMPPNELAVYQRFAQDEFLNGPWNGLMLNSSEDIDRVYLIVFPGQDVLDTILALELERGAPGAMIFAQHPADFEESGHGYCGITDSQFEDLREHQISYYACHAPLDCNREISTVLALAKALKLRDIEPFSPHYSGMEGLHGKVHDMTFPKFAEYVSQVCDLPYIRYAQTRFNGQPVEHVAIIPGGGDNAEQLQLARDLGCDTYVTGNWWPMGTSEFAIQRRKALREVIPQMPMNLLGTSHYASEMVVMRDQMAGWFRNAGIEAKFIKQPDPWR